MFVTQRGERDKNPGFQIIKFLKRVKHNFKLSICPLLLYAFTMLHKELPVGRETKFRFNKFMYFMNFSIVINIFKLQKILNNKKEKAYINPQSVKQKK